jgi:hypothetical protein
MTTRTVGLGVALAAFLALACAGNRIGDPSSYQEVTLNRVFPYPTEDELAGLNVEVVLAAHYSEELPKERVGSAMKPVLASLEGYLSAAGAGVIDRSIHDLATVRDELEAAEAGADSSGFTGADWAIVARFEKFRHWSKYEPPSSLFKNEEELAASPGECKHHGEVEVLLRVFEVPTDDVARASYRLEHDGMFEESEFKRSCPIDATREMIFLEDIVKEALPCLEGPIKNGFSPRGYIEEHRTRPDSGLHIYRTSIGKRNGASLGLKLQIYRVQHMTGRNGQRDRHEQLIGSGTITEQIGDGHSWMLVPPGDLTQPILAGDLVRAVYDDPQSSILGLGICGEALTFQGRP